MTHPSKWTQREWAAYWARKKQKRIDGLKHLNTTTDSTALIPAKPADCMRELMVARAENYADQIRAKHTHIGSNVLTKDCLAAGLESDLADLCAAVLASVVDDLIAISRLERTDFERTKRKERILASAQEPTASALRLAIAASPINGRAAIAHWDTLMQNKHEHGDVGKLAWLLGMQTDAAKKYSRRVDNS